MGNMAFEMSADPEADVEFDGDFSLNPTVGVNAAVRGCYSTGAVEASSYYAGGIAGQQKRGIIKDCFTSGEISAKDGYAGGIAGLSSTEITRCFSLCDLAGENFAGGIAGSGADVSLCYTMARVDSRGESIGAIAGIADGELLHNYFIQEELCEMCIRDRFTTFGTANVLVKNITYETAESINERLQAVDGVKMVAVSYTHLFDLQHSIRIRHKNITV